MILSNLQQTLQGYDKYLVVEKQLNGTVTIYRKSPFSIQKRFKVFTIENQFIGSCMWILKKLALMDTQHIDITGRVAKNNRKLKNKPDDNKMSKELADLIYTNEAVVL